MSIEIDTEYQIYESADTSFRYVVKGDPDGLGVILEYQEYEDGCWKKYATVCMGTDIAVVIGRKLTSMARIEMKRC